MVFDFSDTQKKRTDSTENGIDVERKPKAKCSPAKILVISIDKNCFTEGQ